MQQSNTALAVIDVESKVIDQLDDEAKARKVETEDTAQEGMSSEDWQQINTEIQNQPLEWRRRADKEMDYADGNQLSEELLQALRSIGAPPATENLVGPAIEAIQGFEVSTRTDWRVTADGNPEAAELADAINYKLNQAERLSKADKACTEASRTQFGVGIGWVEVSRETNPFAKSPYRCRVVNRNEMHWDMSSGSTDPDDWRWLRRRRWLHPSRLESMFPDKKDLLEGYGRGGFGAGLDGGIADMIGGTSTGLNNAWEEARSWTLAENHYYNPVNKEVCVSEVWYRVWKDTPILKMKDGRVVEYDEKNDLHNYAIMSGTAKYMVANVPKVRRAYWIGPHKLADEPTPFNHQHFPYVPFFGFTEDSTGVPYGFIRDMIFQQDTLNSGTSLLRYGMGAVRTIRTRGAVDMPDKQFRQVISQRNADIVLNAEVMERQGAVFKVERDFQLNQHQLQLLDNARQAIQRINPAAGGAFSGRRGTATSGVQEQTQVAQATQGIQRMMQNFRDARTMVGELLMALIIEDIGNEEQTVVIDGDAVREDRVIKINAPAVDEHGYKYLTNDLQRTVLQVSLEDVPSTPSYRQQQLQAMSEVVKSLPPAQQMAIMPFMIDLMDVPFRKDVVDALRQSMQQMSPEQVEAMIQEAVQNAMQQSDLKLRLQKLMQDGALAEKKLTIDAAKAEAEIRRIAAEVMQTNVQTMYSGLQGGAQIVAAPMVAPIADKLLSAAQTMPGQPNQAPAAQPIAPQVADVDPAAPAGPAEPVQANTSPAFPPVPEQPDTGMRGIETATTTDNLPTGAMQ